MTFTDYYLGEKEPSTKTRYDVIASTQSHNLLERILINKKDPRKGLLSFYLVGRPGRWGRRNERQSDKAITKGDFNISSVYIPDPKLPFGYGDIHHTNDAVLIKLIKDEDGNIKYIEIFIARGQKNNQLNLYQLAVDGEFDEELEALRQKAHNFE